MKTLIRHGKTKDVYALKDGNILLLFKDTVTGHAGSGESDPGGNDVVGTKAGVARAALKVTTYYFELLKSLKIPTHYVSSNIGKNELIVKKATVFANGLEFIIRYKSTGSFIKRFGDFSKEGDKLDALYEITLKDDSRGDPVINTEILTKLNLMSAAQCKTAEKLTRKVCDIVKDDLAKKGLELVDIKLEIALVDGCIAVIDEISAGNMRVYKNGKQLEYVEVSRYF